MITEARKIEYVSEREEEQHLTRLQKYILLRSHPRRIFLDVVALMWEVYFLWNQNWRAALGVFIVMNTVGLLATRRVNYQELARTTLGKVGLLHLQPMNLIVQLTGIVLSIYGLWWHETISILTGLSLIYAGHFYGWSRVHPALKMRS